MKKRPAKQTSKVLLEVPAAPTEGSITPEQAEAVLGKNYDGIKVIHGSTYKDNSTVIIAPTRGMIHHKVVATWQNLMPLMNQKRAFLIVTGDEVGVAYSNTIAQVLAHPELAKWKYVMTLEDDNLPPPDAHKLLLETIEAYKFDAVSGIYFTKGDGGMPQAYGDPDHYRRTGELEFRPRDIRAALAQGHVMEVNGIAMGCSLYRMDLFRQIPGPWFKTCADLTPEGPKVFTQDLYFCEKAKRAGKTFAVDMRVRVGHMDLVTEEVY